MKKKLSPPLVFLAVIIIPAFLAPVIYPFLQDRFPFERVLSRIVMIFAFLGVAYLIGGDFKALVRYGFTADKKWYRWLGRGLLLGISTLLAIEFFETFLGAFKIGIWVKANRIPERLFKAFLTGLLVGTTEEFFFRGFVFLSLAKRIGWKRSFVLTNVFYALVHFFRGTKQVWTSPDVLDSFRVMLHWFTLMARGQDLLPQFIGLLLFGCILSYAFTKSGALYLPIGIHAGAVFVLKADALFFSGTGPRPVWLYGGKDFSAGLIGWLFLLGLFIVLYQSFRAAPPRRLEPS